MIRIFTFFLICLSIYRCQSDDITGPFIEEMTCDIAGVYGQCLGELDGQVVIGSNTVEFRENGMYLQNNVNRNRSWNVDDSCSQITIQILNEPDSAPLELIINSFIEDTLEYELNTIPIKFIRIL